MKAPSSDRDALLRRACAEERSITVPAETGAVARRLVDRLGGRFSIRFGIAIDRGEHEIERWFFASSLFGNRIRSSVVQMTFRIFEEAGVESISQLGKRNWGETVSLLDRGGYGYYDLLTASRLHSLAQVVERRYGRRVANISRQHPRPSVLEAALDALPGWGPVTVRVFLRELRGVWPGADPPVDRRTLDAVRHLDLADDAAPPEVLAHLYCIADKAHLDVRDLEAALIRLSQVHARHYEICPGGAACVAL